MPAFAAVFALATAALSVTAAPVKRDGAPAHWATGYLEEYDVYHTRYLALNCQDQHNTTFFDSCCHPLLANESLDTRPANCTPSATASSSAAVAAATANTTDSETEYCSEDSAVASYVSSAVSAGATQSVVYTAASTTATLEVQQQIATQEAAPVTSSSAAPAATSSAAASSGNGQTYYGDATYYYQGGNAGACGTVHSDSDKIIAINSNGFWADYASNNNNGNCGKWVTITNTNNGKTVSAMVADVCPTCSGDASIDLSVGAFTAIATESEGMVPIKWSFN